MRKSGRKSAPVPQDATVPFSDLVDEWLIATDLERGREDPPAPPINRAVARAVRMTVGPKDRSDVGYPAFFGVERPRTLLKLWLKNKATLTAERPLQRDAARCALAGLAVLENGRPDLLHSERMSTNSFLCHPDGRHERIYNDSALCLLEQVADLDGLSPNVSALCRTVHRSDIVSAEQIHEALDRLEHPANINLPIEDAFRPVVQLLDDQARKIGNHSYRYAMVKGERKQVSLRVWQALEVYRAKGEKKPCKDALYRANKWLASEGLPKVTEIDLRR